MHLYFALIVFIALLPVLHVRPALAEGCHDGAKLPCAEGAVWDEVRQICAPKPSS